VINIKPKKFKVHSLTGRITPLLIMDAWKAVKRNKGAHGIDGITIQTYGENLASNLQKLMVDLKTRDGFHSLPLRRVYIPKGNTGDFRPLGIPTINIRIAQEIIRKLIEPIFEPQFHDHSYGFRPGRGCHQAVAKVIEYTRNGFKYVVDVDIKGFFDNLDHDLIMTSLRAEIADGNILDIIEKFLRSGVSEDGKITETTRGAPQGGVISPLIANVVLNHLDWHLDANGIQHVRYADDFVILCKSKQEAENALIFVKQALEDLKLECSPEKTKITSLKDGFQFLGFNICEKSITMRQKSREKFEDKIRSLTIRSHNFEDSMIKELNCVIRGTINYFCTYFSSVMRYFIDVGKWVRMRLRSMKYKSISKINNTRCKTKILEKRGLLNIRTLCQHARERWKYSLRGKQMGVAHR
jgi:RNA-directed DNA polymerase